jgi:hypothetical protein
MEKGLEGSGRGIFKVLSRYMPKGTKQNQDSQCPCRNLNREPPQYSRNFIA